jgi:hypothetical protein
MFWRGSGCSVRVIGVMLGQALVFTIYFRSQIYAFLPSSARHAPLNLVCRRPLVWSLLATTVVVFRAWSVASTHQGVCHLGPRVMATLRFSCSVRWHPVDHGEHLVVGSFWRRCVFYMRNLRWRQISRRQLYVGCFLYLFYLFCFFVVPLVVCFVC